eukprot:1160282-Pelagomonas_calceolata.AAC.9
MEAEAITHKSRTPDQSVYAERLLSCSHFYLKPNEEKHEKPAVHHVMHALRSAQVRVLEEHANVRPFPESKSAPSEEHPEDSRPRKYYFLCITKRSPQVRPACPYTRERCERAWMSAYPGSSPSKCNGLGQRGSRDPFEGLFGPVWTNAQPTYKYSLTKAGNGRAGDM